jgi:nicotinamidase-related amidase
MNGWRFGSIALLGLMLVGLSSVGARSSYAQQVPAVPDPVAVTLDPATTALVLLDLTAQTCSQPVCSQGLVPHIQMLLSNARNAGASVVYSVPPSGSAVLPEVAPQGDDPVVRGVGQDRFFNTNLDDILQSKGINTVILAGWRENGSVLYTSVGATLRGYTVVVADDGVSASTDADVAIGRYQMLTQLSANANNQPLKPKAVTLSRSDLISFSAAWAP